MADLRQLEAATSPEISRTWAMKFALPAGALTSLVVLELEAEVNSHIGVNCVQTGRESSHNLNCEPGDLGTSFDPLLSFAIGSAVAYKFFRRR